LKTQTSTTKFEFFCPLFSFDGLTANGLDSFMNDEQYKRGKTGSNGENVVE